jgi:hypothetical protein
LPQFEHDPRAVAPGYDRWEAQVAVPVDSAYAVALGVVLEAGYTVSVASRVDRVITTNLRREIAGAGFNASDHYLRFTVSVLAAGPDSARISVAGDNCFGRSLAECVAVTARDGGPAGSWQFVRRLGDAVVARLAGRYGEAGALR